jgi:hypothetical protein
LSSTDEELTAALKQFPDSGLIRRIQYEAAHSEGKVTKQLLATAAQAEFHHFTSLVAPFTVVNRPRSDYLRQYFIEMQTLKGQ